MSPAGGFPEVRVILRHGGFSPILHSHDRDHATQAGAAEAGRAPWTPVGAKCSGPGWLSRHTFLGSRGRLYYPLEIKDEWLIHFAIRKEYNGTSVNTAKRCVIKFLQWWMCQNLVF